MEKCIFFVFCGAHYNNQRTTGTKTPSHVNTQKEFAWYMFNTLIKWSYSLINVFSSSEKHEANLRPGLHKVSVWAGKFDRVYGLIWIKWIFLDTKFNMNISGSNNKVQCEPEIRDNSSDCKCDTNGGRET